MLVCQAKTASWCLLDPLGDYTIKLWRRLVSCAAQQSPCGGSALSHVDFTSRVISHWRHAVQGAFGNCSTAKA